MPLLSPCTSPRPRPSEIGLVVLLVAIGAFLRMCCPDLVFFSLHTARDLYRTQLLIRGVEFPLLGSELQYGGRVLGPGMYLLMAIPMWISNGPLTLSITIGLLNSLMLPVIWWGTRLFLGRSVALWTLALYAVFPLEIGQLRHNWNPAFLPIFSAGALFALLAVALRGRAWFLLLLAFCIAFGIQLHLSAIELFIPAALILILARKQVRLAPALSALILFVALFTPLIIHEATAPKSGLAEVVTSPLSDVKKPKRISYNHNSIPVFLLHTRLQMYEGGKEVTGFGGVDLVHHLAPTVLGKWPWRLARAINAFGQVQLIFWVAGVGTCCGWIVRHARRRTRGPDTREPMLLGVAVLGWQFTPLVFMLFFNYHGFETGEPMSLAPIRYFVVGYPTHLIAGAIGVVTISAFAQRKLGSCGGRVVQTLAALLVVSYAVFCLLYLATMSRSGWQLPYGAPNHAPTLRTMIQARDLLLGEAKLDRDAWFKRTHSVNFLRWWTGESTLDWLMTQDERLYRNPSPDPHLRWVFHGPAPHPTQDIVPKDGTEVRRWRIDPAKADLIEYRVADPTVPVPENLEMRNWYFQKPGEYMRYLGPDAELRKETGER